MTKKLKKIVFFGNERLATQVLTEVTLLKGLLANGYTVVAIVINQDDFHSRKERTLEIENIAKQHHIPVLSPANPKDILDQLKAYEAVVGVLAAYGRIVPQSVIDVFPKGIVNIHPSLLPKGRGPTPIEQAILNGETQTGVSIMKLVQKMDEGPIYAQDTVQLRGNETKQLLAATLSSLGLKLLLEVLPLLIEGKINVTEQNNSEATYSKLLTKQDGIIDWNKPAIRLESEVRAFLGWPKSRTNLGSLEVIITKARVVSESLRPGEIKIENNRLIVGTGDKSLEIESIQPVNKPQMDTGSFLAGYRKSIE